MHRVADERRCSRPPGDTGVGGASCTAPPTTVSIAGWPMPTVTGDRKKRTFRALWIVRINAAARLNGLSYSRLVNGLKKAGVDVNRKVLADLAVTDAEAFAALSEQAKQHI